MAYRRSPIGREHEVVTQELGDRLQSVVSKFEGATSAIALRNSVLLAASRAVGNTKMHHYASMKLAKEEAGSSQLSLFGSAYSGSEHAEALSRSSGKQAEILASIACSMCPLQFECGIQPDELLDKLEDAKVRRRFNGRLGANANRFCLTNMRPGRLKKSDI